LAAADVDQLTFGGQPFEGELADRFQHPEARLVVDVLLAHQALVDQRSDEIEGVGRR
jgi:hypothetical protein